MQEMDSLLVTDVLLQTDDDQFLLNTMAGLVKMNEWPMCILKQVLLKYCSNAKLPIPVFHDTAKTSS